MTTVKMAVLTIALFLSSAAISRDWIHLEDQAISIPKMKSGRSFDLPLSQHMVEILQRALELGDVLYPGAPWLFPTRSSKDQRTVIATQVWREKTLPSETGHILRHTYRTIAQREGIDKIEARELTSLTVCNVTLFVENMSSPKDGVLEK